MNNFFHFGNSNCPFRIKNGTRRDRQHPDQSVKEIEAGLLSLVFDSVEVAFRNICPLRNHLYGQLSLNAGCLRNFAK